MPRTTVDIDGSVLRDLKRMARDEGKSLGQIISELVAVSLARGDSRSPKRRLRWTAQPMRARVDIEDKDRVYSILDRR